MGLRIIEEKRISWTVWKIVDENENLIGRFDSRGGYSRADAEAIVRDDPESPESIAEERMARAENLFDSIGKQTRRRRGTLNAY